MNNSQKALGGLIIYGQCLSRFMFYLIFKCIISNMRRALVTVPSIAQLVERRTVEVKLSSLGRWFESGSKE